MKCKIQKKLNTHGINHISNHRAYTVKKLQIFEFSQLFVFSLYNKNLRTLKKSAEAGLNFYIFLASFYFFTVYD